MRDQCFPQLYKDWNNLPAWEVNMVELLLLTVCGSGSGSEAVQCLIYSAVIVCLIFLKKANISTAAPAHLLFSLWPLSIQSPLLKMLLSNRATIPPQLLESDGDQAVRSLSEDWDGPWQTSHWKFTHCFWKSSHESLCKCSFLLAFFMFTRHSKAKIVLKLVRLKLLWRKGNSVGKMC